MDSVFVILGLISFAAMVVGLIRPGAVGVATRGKALRNYGLSWLAFSMLAAALADPVENSTEEQSATAAVVEDPAAADNAVYEAAVPSGAEREVLEEPKAVASIVPEYNITDHCESVSQAAGGSYAIKSTCIDQEKKARKKVQRMNDLELRIRDYCDEVAATIGGSYEIFLTCVQEEIRAKGRGE